MIDRRPVSRIRRLLPLGLALALGAAAAGPASAQAVAEPLNAPSNALGPEAAPSHPAAPAHHRTHTGSASAATGVQPTGGEGAPAVQAPGLPVPPAAAAPQAAPANQPLSATTTGTVAGSSTLPAGSAVAGGASGVVTPATTTVGTASPTAAGLAPHAPPPLTPLSSLQASTAASPLPAAQPDLTTVQQTVSQLEARAGSVRSDAELAALRDQAAAAQASAADIVTARQKDLESVDAELKRIDLQTPGRKRAPTAEEQRQARLLRTREADLQTQIKSAQAAGAEASDTYDQIASRRRAAFDARVFHRTASPLAASFWTSLVVSVSPDIGRLVVLLGEALQTMLDAPEPRALLFLAAGAALALLLMIPVRRAMSRLLRRRTLEDAGERRGFRLTAHAVGGVVVGTLLPAASAIAVNLAADWAEVMSDRAEAMAQALVIAVVWGSAVVALGRYLIAADDPGERVLTLPERTADRLQSFPWMIALTTGLGFVLRRLNTVVGASVSATVAANCLLALANAGVAGLFLLALGDVGPASAGEAGEADAAAARGAETADEAAHSSALTLISLAFTVAIIATVAAVLTGYTTLAVLISGQVFWFSVLAGATYLLLRFADDAVGELFKPSGWIGRPLAAVMNLRLTTVGQLGVVTSAALQILIVLAALMLALTPFGAGGDILGAHLKGVGQAVRFGSLTLSPRSVAAGLASLLIGLVVVHGVQRWIDRRYLPVTDWDAGVRNSVSTGVRYFGIGVAVLWALAAAGLGFRQIALVASALSVGIGFGLQQVVQNFVSGLILLVERPVKVGDWVNVGGVEGDVKNIRVRATEIQTFDRTSVIVPNSELITKAVQNKTSGDPRGRLTLQLTIARAGDAERAAALILEVMQGAGELLDDPPAAAYIDSLPATGGVSFTAFAYVDTPRHAFKARSLLYGRVLKALADAGIDLAGSTPTSVVMEPGPALKGLFDKAEAGAAKPPAAREAPADPDAPRARAK